MLKYKYIIFLILLASCNPYQFHINYKEANLYEVYNLAKLGCVEELNDNSIQLFENARVSIRNYEIVPNTIKFNFILNGSTHLKIALHNKKYNYQENDALLLNIDGKKVSLYHQGKLLTEKYVDIKPNEEKLFQIINFGNNLKISIDCVEIINSSLKQVNSEYIILETDENTKAAITGIKFE